VADTLRLVSVRRGADARQPELAKEDLEGAVEPLLNLDEATRVTGARCGQVQNVTVEVNGVVGSDPTHVLEAEEAVELSRSEAPGRLWVTGRNGELAVVAREEATEDPIRLREGAGSGKSQLTGQAVLEGAPKALDTTLALGRASEHLPDLEFLKEPAELGRVAATLELLFQAELVLLAPKEDAVTVGVDGKGHALADHGPSQHPEVALGILLEAELGRSNAVAGVIDGTDQAQIGPAPLEPVVAAGVDLEQHAGLREAVPTPAMLGRSTTTRGGDAGCFE
jgi:hypothetical protein